jgi:hypothetical protein
MPKPAPHTLRKSRVPRWIREIMGAISSMRDAGTDVSAVEFKIRLVLGGKRDDVNEGPENIVELLK